MALELRHCRRHRSACKHKDEILVNNLYLLRGCKAMKLINEFPNKWWTKININRLLIKFGDTGTVKRLTDSGGPLSIHTEKMLTWLTIWCYAADSQNGPW